MEWDVFTGHLEAPEIANISARVSGLIVETPFPEGALVKKGDVLALIDERPFKADWDSKLAEQKKQEAQLLNYEATLKRYKAIEGLNSVSRQELDNAQSNYDQGVAAVNSAKAAAELSRLNLEWCRVESPISGRVSFKMVTVGNLVTSGGGMGMATMLTTIQSVDRVYCYVDMDEGSVLKYERLADEGKLASLRRGKMPCRVQLANEKGFPHLGRIDFVDNHVDSTTGTQRVRGVLPNADESLTPGYFARLSVPASGRYEALLVPEAAVGSDQDQQNVLTVGPDNKVLPKAVKLGALFGNLRVITSGIGPDDRVIITGRMHAIPGTAVDPKDGDVKVDEAMFVDPGMSVAMPAGATTESTMHPTIGSSMEGSSTGSSMAGSTTNPSSAPADKR